MKKHKPGHRILKRYCQTCGREEEFYGRCSVRTCSICRLQDYERLRDQYGPFLMGLDPITEVKLVTLMMERQPHLRLGVERIQVAWKKLLRRKLYKTLWRGGLRCIEPKRKPAGWHVHIHAIVEGKFVPYQQLSNDWQAVNDVPARVTYIEEAWTPQEALVYVLKYLKHNPQVLDGRTEYNRDLKKVRLYQAWGNWYGKASKKKHDAFPCRTCGGNIPKSRPTIAPRLKRTKVAPAIRNADSMITQARLMLNGKAIGAVSLNESKDGNKISFEALDPAYADTIRKTMEEPHKVRFEEEPQPGVMASSLREARAAESRYTFYTVLNILADRIKGLEVVTLSLE